MNKLLELRKKYKFTREELSRVSGVGKTTIYSLEKGILSFENCKLSTILALAQAFGVGGVVILPNDIREKMI